MRPTHLLLWSIARIVPTLQRDRWLEEWRSEVRHGGSRMLSGAVPDAWAVRRLHPAPDQLSRRIARVFHGLPDDFRYGLRGLRKAPGFTFSAIASLSLGIGASTGVFTLVNAMFFSPFPGVSQQDELVQLRWYPPGHGLLGTSTYGDFRALAAGLTTLGGLSASSPQELAIVANGQAREISGALVSGNYFDVLGARAARGRFFIPEEDDVPLANPAAVISYRLWQDQFAGAETIVGQTMLINGVDVRIVGIAPEAFSGTLYSYGTSVWIPFSLSELALRGKDGSPVHIAKAGPLWLHYVGRRNAGTSVDEVHAQARVIAAATLPPVKGSPRQIWVVPERRSDLERDGPRIAGLLALPFIVLVIACVNAANLLLARASRRRTELVVRLAVGASRWRVIRQLLVECLLVGSGAAVAGLAVSYWLLQLQEQLLPLPFPVEIVLDIRVLTFTIVLALITAVMFGLGPALSATRNASVRAPFSLGRGGRVRVTLVALQAALSLALLGTGVQFVRTLQSEIGGHGLTDPERHLVGQFDLVKLGLTDAQAQRFFDELLARTRQIPSVRAAGLTGIDFIMGGIGADSLTTVWLPGDAPAKPRREVGGYVAGELFEAIERPLLKGRAFAPADASTRPTVVVVDDAFARQHFGGDAIGRQLRIGGHGTDYAASHEVTVVGIVGSRYERVPMLFSPAPLGGTRSLTLHVQLQGDTTAVADQLRTIVREIDGRVPIRSLWTARELWRRYNVFDDLVAVSVTSLGVMALLLAAGGLYCVVSYLVAMREKEIGIRMSLGATSTHVVRMVVMQALGPSVVGCLLGAAGAITVGQLVRSRLYGASPVDTIAMAGTAVLLLVVLVLASAIPARRAARVDPLTVLRAE